MINRFLGHYFTIVGSLYPRRFNLPGAQERYVQTEQTTRVRLLCHWQTNAARCPTIILVHGLEGDAQRSYMLGAAQKAYDAGFNVVRTNVRNCGGTEHLTPTLYHSGFTTDLRFIIDQLIQQDGLTSIVLLGFSMGGNHVLKLAGQWGRQAPKALRALAAISPAIDLAACSRAIAKMENKIYDYRFLKSLKQKVRLKNKIFPGQFKFPNMEKSRNLWEFDDCVTAPHFGYKNAADYYAKASALSYLGAIALPTLIIRAQNDPFIPATNFAAIKTNSYIQDRIFKNGGHLGFFKFKNGQIDYWAEAMAIDFLKQNVKGEICT